MPTVYPIEWTPVVKGARYRHMSRRDTAIWEQFIPRAALAWEMVAYDVAMGGAWPNVPQATDDDRRGFQYSTALRLDALLRRGEQYAVVEVKPECSVGALGGALCYTLMLARVEPALADITPTVLCEFASADARWLAERLGVIIETV